MSENTLVTTKTDLERVQELTDAIGQYVDQGKIEQALALLSEAEALVGDDFELQGLVCVARSRIARGQQQPTDALLHAHEALQQFIQAGSQQRQASTLILIGSMYFELGDYGQSIEALSQALDLAVALQDRSIEANAIFRLAFCYQRMGLFAEALAALDQCEPVYRDENNMLALTQSLNCRQIIYREMSQRVPERRAELLQKAQVTLDQARAYAEQLGNQQMLRVLHGNQGRLYAARGEYERALEIYEQELADNTAMSLTNQALQWISLGTAQRHLGRHAESIEALNRAVAIAEAGQSKRELALAHQELSQIYEQVGETGLAFEHYKQYHQIESNMYREQADRVARITSLRLSAERERVAAELQAQLAQHEHEALRERAGLLEQLLQERTSALDRQNEMLELIDQLSTPVLPLLRGVLVVPLVGQLDQRRCTRLTEELLKRVSQEQAQVVLLDITGVLVVDPTITSALVDAARAVRLLGCRLLVVGIRPEIAQAIVGMGLSLDEMQSYATLVEGLRAALAQVGFALTPSRARPGM